MVLSGHIYRNELAPKHLLLAMTSLREIGNDVVYEQHILHKLGKEY